jgi:hypothetical protein
LAVWLDLSKATMIIDQTRYVTSAMGYISAHKAHEYPVA